MFPERAATKPPSTNRKPVFGIGINDADYVVQPTINGKRVSCPYYVVWKNMLMRCYCSKYQKTYPTHTGCWVAGEWLTFTNFRSWMIEQDWKYKHLDKDIINPVNKLYSPETCCFVTQVVNHLLTDHAGDRGLYPQGVHFNQQNNRFRAKVRINGKQKHLGYFTTPKAASAAYIKAKSAHIIEIAKQQADPRIKYGLLKHAELMRNQS